MPQYLAPGVYVEEVKSAVQPIAGVSTSTAGFIGHVANDVKMPPQPGKFQVDASGNLVLDTEGNPVPVPYTLAPAGEPQLVTSWERFKTLFGDFQKKDDDATASNKVLAHAVYGFFNNGGSRCWVTRLAEDLSASNFPTKVTDALAKFAAIDEISLVAVPGSTDDAVQDAVVSHCKNTSDRFAILDGEVTNTLTPAAIKGGAKNSDYAALYFPRIQVFDPVTEGPIDVHPSGHIAGIYARVDTERGVHKAPANEVVRGALGLAVRLSKADQDGLNPAGINCIRDLNGSITVWGARTLGGDANLEWKYVSTRRLFLFLRESIDEGTQWVVFEPNDQSLWAKITRNITAFLTNVWRSGALFGATPQEAFYVRCDATTNPPEVRDLGQVVTEIGVAVVKPAEFVIFRISQWAGPGQ
ncbi:MAG TPA: phage tail sheath subtilisin-like domain-containing protein [Thermoanaerobaculia bacterium]